MLTCLTTLGEEVVTIHRLKRVFSPKHPMVILGDKNLLENALVRTQLWILKSLEGIIY